MNFTRLRLLILVIPFLFPSCDGEPEVPVQVDWIKANANRPTSVDPANTNFEDLRFLKTVIGNRRLVMLGEQTHGDGTTFYAKTRLIKFLHQEMDFDIIAFESGLYDCHKSFMAIKGGMNGIQAAKKGISKVWSHTQEVYPLFEYLDDSPYTIELIGMDPQFFGTYKNELSNDLESFLQRKNSAIVNSANWQESKALLTETLLAELDPAGLGQIKLNNANALLESLVTEIASFDQTIQPELLNDTGFWLQVLYNIIMTIQIHQQWMLGDIEGHSL